MTAAVQLDPYRVEPQQPGQQQGLTPEEEAVIAALALFLASVVAVKAVTLPSALVGRLVGLGLPRRAVAAAGKLTLEPALTGRTRWGSPTPADLSEASSFNPPLGFPGSGSSPTGSQGHTLSIVGSRADGSAAERARAAIEVAKTSRRFGPPTMAKRMAANEPLMRARYLLAAAKRLAKAAAEGRFIEALRREQDYLDAHRKAGQRRARIAREYDVVAQGQTFLRWVAVMDKKTTADCAALDGSIWNVNNPPFPPPGAQHSSCRCSSVPVGSPLAALAAA